MKPIILTEKEYQNFILDKLDENKYRIRDPKPYDAVYAMDRELLFEFLHKTQPESMDTLTKIYKENTEEVIVSTINMEETKTRGSRLNVIQNGINISNVHLNFYYGKPATKYNIKLNNLYKENIFSAAKEVYASPSERVDIVTYLNGFAITTMELKANTSGQSYEDAIKQYRNERNPKTRLFMPKSGALVHFAMDLEQVHMTTKLEKASTYFIPFNMGCGDGINAGRGNPIFEDKYSVYYMWENILSKDTIIDIISKFMFIETKEVKDKKTGKRILKDTLVFPRFHQLDVVTKTLNDVLVNKTNQNYLFQHFAGSGKTYEIAWLAHRLATLHDENDEPIYNNVVVCTDRVQVDRHLQKAVLALNHKSGFVKVMGDNCTSSDLANALNNNTKIVVTTIQKFPYILGSVKTLSDKNFAVIIDEAHSSTSGKNMSAVTSVLGGEDEEFEDIEDIINAEIAKNGKQKNISMFAFTATPKETTLQLFGTTNKKGQKEAFHTYSMKQAIEEEYIVNVLENYITYETLYKLSKEIESDPKVSESMAKKSIARFANLHPTNIAQKVEIIVEHFRTSVMNDLGGMAKGMVVTSSRAAAVKFKLSMDEYIKRNGYKNFNTVVAFSGTVTVDGVDYTESGMNGFSENALEEEFDKDNNRLLIVANKHQTGFDQPKLCAMYILKTLKNTAAVQTTNRLNRIFPPFNKKTIIIDFANTYEDICKYFSKYYTTTLLSNSVTPSAIYDLEAKIDGYYILDPMDIDRYNAILYKKENINAKDKRELEFILQKTKRNIITGHSQEEQREIIGTFNGFKRFYEFLIKAVPFEDTELHKKYNLINSLSKYLKRNSGGTGFNVDEQIKILGFVQKKTAVHEKSKVVSDPIVHLPLAEQVVLSEQKQEYLSKIIADINNKTGKKYDNDVAVKAMLQVKDIMMKSEYLKASAENNTEKEFEFAYFDNVDDALIEGLAQNQDFFTLLLQNDEIKKEVLGIFASEIYKSLRSR